MRTFVWLLMAASSMPAQVAHPQFARLCALCHGGDAAGTDRGPTLVNNRSLRSRSEMDIRNVIRNGLGGMPSFPLAENELTSLASFVRSLNVSAFELSPAGDAASGESFFHGRGGCAACHTALGRGQTVGPDLSNVGRQLTLAELEQSLDNPGARIAPGYSLVTATLNDGKQLRGFARSQGNHDLQMQTPDSRLHLLIDTEWKSVSKEAGSLMPALNASRDERRDLVAYLSKLGGVSPGPLKYQPTPVDPRSAQRIVRPEPGEWPTYHGNVSGNRHSSLKQIDTQNVKHLQVAWTYSIPYFGLETTPIVSDGVMYVTGPNQVYALDARTGREIWKYQRPRTPSGVIAGDAAKGANRGVALSGDRVFYITDNAHLICLNRLTGALQWEILLADEPQHYGGTSAPLVIGNLVYAGVAGADEGIRGFVGAWEATTGALAWRFWTVPKAGEPGAETWSGNAMAIGGGSTWLTGTYDPESNLLFWPTGNPFPDTDGDERKGDNLFTNCDLALDATTGKLKWHFQFTPHDLHDWDAIQPPVLIDSAFRGRQRKLLLHANRNGFFYVLDRTSGEMLLAKPFVKKLTWASAIDAKGRPQLLPANVTKPSGVKTCPAVRGATNWYSTAFSPKTGLYYIMAVEDCGIYRKAAFGGFGRFNDPSDPPKKFVRALNIETGAVAWEIPLEGPTEANYAGVLSTEGDLLFYGESTGGFAAAHAATGKHLWHFEANQPLKASPITYTVGGRQHVAIASGANILSFTIPEHSVTR